MNVADEIKIEDALRDKLRPVFGTATDKKVLDMAVNSIMRKNRDMEILKTFASTLESA